MKTRPCLILACLALSSSLMAAPPIFFEVPDLDMDEVDKRMEELTQITYGNNVRRLIEMEPNEDAIQSILQNKENHTDAPSMNAPIVIRSMEDAAKHLNRASMEQLDYDFSRFQLVIFAWKGSDQDKLHGHMGKGKEPEADFRYIPVSLPPRQNRDGLFGDKKAGPDGRITQSAVFIMTKHAKICVRQLSAPFGRVHACK